MSGLDNENKTTRKRAKNYTTEEEVLLVELVDAHKNCIENKKSDSIIWKQKEEAWKKIEEKFAATIGTHRHWKALRDKYEIIKRKSKIEIADYKLETYRTGGGVAPTKISSVSAKVAAMLGDSATGLQNSFDSDCAFTGFDGEYLDVEIVTEGTEQKTNEKFDNSTNSVEEKSDWSTWRPNTLKKPKSKELVVNSKRKRNIEEEKLELVILQQQFYRDENRRAQEKHEQELLSLKLKNKILELEFESKKR